MTPRLFRNSFVYLIITVAVVAIFMAIISPNASGRAEDLSRLFELARQGGVSQIEVQGDTLTVYPLRSEPFRVQKEPSTSVVELLSQAGVPLGEGGPRIIVRAPSQLGQLFGFFLNFLPLLFLLGLFLFMMRQAQGTNNQALQFGRSRARVFTGNRPSVTFNDVAGADEAKQELQEVVEFLKSPERFGALGARIPRGVLLLGSPGTGKTLLARAVAGEAGVPFFSISGSEFVEMFVGVGASRVRDLFDQAKRNAPCLIFVDEIDAVGRQRGTGLGGSHDEREQTLNQILVEMDGFDTSASVVVLAATNRPDILDPALLRPGRFDRQVIMDRPDIRGRKAILEVHARGKPFEPDVDLGVIARQTPGFTGADLANLINEAAILAARQNKRMIAMGDLAEAVDRVVAGPERRSRIISPREKQIIAYHEAGHALVSRHLKEADRVHKITIMPRGAAGGYTRFLPEEDHYLITRSQFMAMLTVALGGHVAEELHLGEMTTGPSDDIERATRMVRQMVMQYGMSERLGPRAFGKKDELIFLGREISEQRNYSEKVAVEIDEEIQRFIRQGYESARRILTAHRRTLDALVEILIREETLEGEALTKFFREQEGAALPSTAEGVAEAEEAPREEAVSAS